MKSLGAGAVVVCCFLLGNVVAAGVFTILGPMALQLEDDAHQVAALAAIGLVAVGCAALFLLGAATSIPRWINFASKPLIRR